MWFKNKKEEVKPKWLNDWEEIQKLYPIGSAFKFLDRIMVVKSYSNYIPPNKFFPVQLPYLECSYSDNNGVIHDYNFKLREWRYLKFLCRA